MANQTTDEQETMFNVVASDRNTIHVFSDDPFWMRRLDKFGTFVRNTGEGKEYTLRADQLVVRAGKKQVSETQRAASVEKMRKIHAAREMA